MRIAVFHDLPPGGGLRLARDFCRGLEDRGHTVELHVFENSDEGLFAIAPFASKVLRYRPLALEPFPAFRPYAAWRGVELVRKVRLLLSLKRRHREIARAIDRAGYDVVLVQSCRHTQAPWILRYLQSPTIYFANEPLRVVYDDPLERPRSGRRDLLTRFNESWSRRARSFETALLEEIDRANIASASCLLTSSRHTRERLFDCYGLRAELCHPGVDLDLFEPAEVETRNQVLSVGSLWRHKNHRLTIQALGLVEPSVRPELVLVTPHGSAQHLEELRVLAADSGVHLDVRWKVSEEALVRAYRQSLALVHVARSEPFGMAALEAMACGTPVIAVDEGGLRESVIDGETGIVIQRDAAECAAAIRRLIRDAATRRRLGSQARTHVERDWSAGPSIDRLEAQLQRVASRGR